MTIQDFKFTTCYSAQNGVKSEWLGQLNLLAHFARENGFPVENLELVLILRDWSKTHIGRSAGYSEAPVLKMPVEVWPEETCEEYLDTRLRLHMAAKKDLPECSPNERWAKPDAWAIKREGRKTAVRVLDNEADAHALAEVSGQGHTVEHRPGCSIRCENFCSAAPFCSQWASIPEQVGK